MDEIVGSDARHGGHHAVGSDDIHVHAEVHAREAVTFAARGNSHAQSIYEADGGVIAAVSSEFASANRRPGVGGYSSRVEDVFLNLVQILLETGDQRCD